ncbi:MAG TPA: DUF4833 domain-containing protein [bacterium]|nr:DUF4833 domain-containing protein [bacterium]
MKKIKLVFLLTALSAFPCHAKEKKDAGSAEKISYQRIFAIKRSVNSNQVIYEAALGKDGFRAEAPLRVYWIVYEEGGKTAPLSKLQEKLGYGIIVTTSTAGGVTFKVRALPEKPIKVNLSETDGETKATALINIGGEECVIDGIYIESRSAFPLPKVTYIDIIGFSLKTNERMSERVVPGKER